MQTKKKPFYKKPVFWTTLIPILLVSVVVIVLVVTIMDSGPILREPANLSSRPTVSGSDPLTSTDPTLPPPPSNPYGPEDFIMDGDKVTLKTGTAVLGIDVSTWQNEINWKKVKKSGVEFAMIRLGNRGYGNGNIVEDPYFKANLEGAKAAGIKVGVYFFSQAISVAEAVEEAQFVLDTLAGAELDMPVVYDWEYISEEARTAHVDRRTLTDCSLAFLQHIETAGYKPMLYINTSQVRNLLHLSELEHYDCWLALYSDTMSYPYRIKMWQYTCTGSVPGIKGPCDVNLYFPEVS